MKTTPSIRPILWANVAGLILLILLPTILFAITHPFQIDWSEVVMTIKVIGVILSFLGCCGAAIFNLSLGARNEEVWPRNWKISLGISVFCGIIMSTIMFVYGNESFHAMTKTKEFWAYVTVISTVLIIFHIAYPLARVIELFKKLKAAEKSKE
jgi:uncharacterized membrane protein